MAVPSLKMYRSDTMVEVGTEVSPIDFGLCLAGQTTDLPYELILYNDKDEILGSSDAKELVLSLLQMNVIEEWISDGNPSQTFTMIFIPLVTGSEEITIDGDEWVRVTNFTSSGPSSEHYTLDYTTGILTFGNGARGKIPTIGSTIQNNYIPDLNIYGKEVYNSLWVEVMSAGLVPTPPNNINVDIELGEKIDDDYVRTIHYPIIISVAGVWDNISKTGTNYYTSGSFDANTGIITLGSTMTAPNPYIEYVYTIKDDNETNYSQIGLLTKHVLENPIPKNNAKRIFARVTIPPTADTESGAFIQVRLRVEYEF